MKKSIFDKHSVFILVIISVCLAIFISTNTQQIQANNNISSNQNYDFSDLEKQGLSFNYINENEFTINIPVSMVNKEKIDSIIESQNNPKTRGFWTIIGIVGTSCWLIETVTTFDACQYMVQQSLRIMATGKKGLNGKYKVTYTYVPGRVPGCEPIHSGPCNAGYYKASYSRIGDV